MQPTFIEAPHILSIQHFYNSKDPFDYVEYVCDSNSYFAQSTSQRTTYIVSKNDNLILRTFRTKDIKLNFDTTIPKKTNLTKKSNKKLTTRI